jgi:hypothetical protein
LIATIQKQQGAEGLILGGGSDVLVHGQMGQNGFDFLASHLLGVAFVVEQNVAFDPVYISLLGANGIVFEPDDVTNLI